jgi:hypothetical protein
VNRAERRKRRAQLPPGTTAEDLDRVYRILTTSDEFQDLMNGEVVAALGSAHGEFKKALR